jgi:hypothetical protein
VRSVTLTVLCEGPTEQRFVAQVLGPHLRTLRVFPKGQLMTPGGGVVKFQPLREVISRVLDQGKDHFVTTMLDLYALPADYPAHTPRAGEAGSQRAMRIETAMRQKVNNQRFVPYIQVHEFEALLFTDLEAVASHFPDEDTQAIAAQLRRHAKVPPEDVDDGKETAPSKRILKVVAGYSKQVDGPAIVGRIGLDPIRRACPHFAGWIERLERLAPEPDHHS